MSTHMRRRHYLTRRVFLLGALTVAAGWIVGRHSLRANGVLYLTVTRRKGKPHGLAVQPCR